MKILVLYPYPVEADGISLQGSYLVKGLKELGVEVKSCDRNNDDLKEKLYKEFKPDVVIGVGFWGNVPELILHPMKFGMKVAPWFNANGWVANYHNVLNNLPLLIATSNWVKSTYIRDDVKGDHISVCPIGYNPNVFFKNKIDEESMKLRKELGILDNEVMLFTAGGDVTSKGAQEMFRALAKFDSEFKDWKYVMKTFPSFSSRNHGLEERNLIKELGLDFKKFINISENYPPIKMAELLMACDVYAAPSRLEGFGMIQVEAMACGKPVVSINVGGPKDTVVDGVTGFLVDVEHEIKLNNEWVYRNMGFKKKMMIDFPRPKTFAYRANVDQLAECTLKLFKDVGLREKMGLAGSKHVLENFHYKVVAERMLDLIKERVLNK